MWVASVAAGRQRAYHRPTIQVEAPMKRWRRWQRLGLAVVMAVAGGAWGASTSPVLGAPPSQPLADGAPSAAALGAVPARPPGCNGTAITIIQMVNKPIPDATISTPG